MRDGILDDDGLNLLRVCQCKPEAHWPTIVLQIQAVALQTECNGEAVDHLGQMVEGVGE